MIRQLERDLPAFGRATHGVAFAAGLEVLVVTGSAESGPRLVGLVIERHQPRHAVWTVDPHLIGLAAHQTRYNIQLLDRLPVGRIVTAHTDRGARLLPAAGALEVAGEALDVGRVLQ